MAKPKPKKKLTKWELFTRIAVILAAVIGLLTFLFNLDKTKKENERVAKGIYLQAWDELAGFSGSAEIKQDTVTNNPAARQRAMDLVEQGLVLVPNHPDLLAVKGVILHEQGNKPEAERLFRRAISLGPSDPVAYTGLGVILQDANKPDEALAVYEQALKLQSDDLWTVHYNIASAYQEKGDLKNAAASFRNAIQLRADYAEAYQALADVLVLQQKPDEALAASNKANALLRARQPPNATSAATPAPLAR